MHDHRALSLARPSIFSRQPLYPQQEPRITNIDSQRSSSGAHNQTQHSSNYKQLHPHQAFQIRHHLKVSVVPHGVIPPLLLTLLQSYPTALPRVASHRPLRHTSICHLASRYTVSSALCYMILAAPAYARALTITTTALPFLPLAATAQHLLKLTF